MVVVVFLFAGLRGIAACCVRLARQTVESLLFHQLRTMVLPSEVTVLQRGHAQLMM
jgi:hypothetical protein